MREADEHDSSKLETHGRGALWSEEHPDWRALAAPLNPAALDAIIERAVVLRDQAPVKPAPVISRPHPRWSRKLAFVGAGAFAAGLALVLRPDVGLEPFEQPNAVSEPFELIMPPGGAPTRSDALHNERAFYDLRNAPGWKIHAPAQTQVDGLRLYLGAQTESEIELLHPDISQRGRAYRVEGELGAIGLRPGDVTVHFLLGPAAHEAEVLSHLRAYLDGAGLPASWQVQSRRITIGAWDAAFAGCGDVIDVPGGPVCELDDSGERRIDVWAPEQPVLRIDGIPQTPISRVLADGGWIVGLEVPRGARVLTLSNADVSAELWRLSFAWTTAESNVELVQSRRAREEAYQRSNYADCQREARRGLALAIAQRRGAAAMLAARTGAMCSSGADQMREWVASAAQVPTGPDEREVDRGALEAQYFHMEGSLPQALAATERGLHRAMHTGLGWPTIELLLIKANLLAEVGDFTGAVAVMHGTLERVSALDPEPCVHASIYLNLAWALLQQAERVPGSSRAGIHDALRRGRELVEASSGRCPRREVFPLWMNTVRALQLEHRWRESEAELVSVGRRLDAGDDPELHAEFQLLRARQLLALGRVNSARAALDAVGERGDRGDDLALELTLARGQVEEAKGAYRRAFEVYQGARRKTTTRLGGLPSDGGLQRFLVDRMQGIQRLVVLAWQRFGDNEGAFRIAREAAGTEVRWLEQRGPDRESGRSYLAWRDEHEQATLDAWDLPSAERQALQDSTRRATDLRASALLAGTRAYDPEHLELRKPAANELLLLYFPLDARRFLGFAATADGVRIATIDGLPSMRPLGPDGWSDEELGVWSELLLAPFAKEVDRARSVRVLPSFGVQALPFHAFPWHERPLIAHAEVAYSLDLAVRDAGPPADGENRVLIVGDPRGDLAGARSESEALQSYVAASGPEVLSLVGAQATGPSVRAGLAQSAHFHYAGHSAAAGPFGWASTLRLADETSLSIADIVALERVPRTVMLLSCDAGHVSQDPRAQGISLAAAFVFAGTEAVIAMSSPVDAHEAPRLASAFHGQLADAASFIVTYRTGMLNLRHFSVSRGAWQGLRLWVP